MKKRRESHQYKWRFAAFISCLFLSFQAEAAEVGGAEAEKATNPVGVGCPEPNGARAAAKACTAAFNKTQSFCTEQGLAKLNTANVVGGAITGGVSLVQANSKKPGSAKKAMQLGSKMAYGMGALNAGIGIKCMFNIKSCTKACGAAQAMLSACTKSTLSGNAASIKILEDVDPKAQAAACEGLKGNAVAALGQGAAFGITGLFTNIAANKMGGEDEEDKPEEDSPVGDPRPMAGGEGPPGGGGIEPPPEFDENGGDGSDESGISSLAGNTDDGPGKAPPEDPFSDLPDPNNDPNATYASGSGGAGSSSGDNAGTRAAAGGLGSGGGGLAGDDDEYLEDDIYGPERSFAGGSSGGGGGGSLYGGGGEGLFDSGGGKGGSAAAQAAKKKAKDKISKLKALMGGKHESIFDKASGLITSYCMKGALRCR